ncbi:hypothetical protein D5F01_LYC11201 [Larimichthys crocea]|uniref:Uncharacterized protein n=2 Tax=Larimichthys crocea TaxID=215358 RepID=A0A6G0IDC6_LARCR|nr:uncharacterized protein LOC113747647 isoform X2 [Larimichthys crocea]KAE8289499.1 hypothetical protein D5F01_LYC11201 [Larimichthys crocea]
MHQRTELQVFAKPIVNTVEAILICHTMSTDKSVSSVHLIGDGASKASGITITGPVPSEDGSVILRLTARISLSQNTNMYGCRILTGGHNFTVFWDGNTLDGRHLYKKSSVNWIILTKTLGFCCIMVTIIIICCVTTFLKCVKMRSSRPPTIDPRLVKQFSRMVESVTSPDLQNVVVSYTQCTERNRAWDQWVVRFTSEDQDFYDPEYFAINVDGAHR